MVSVQLCTAIAEAIGKPTLFEPGVLYYEKETGLRYACQDVFKSGPAMVRIGGGNGKARIMNPEWFVRVLTEPELYAMVKHHRGNHHAIVIESETKTTTIKFKKPEDTTYEFKAVGTKG
jgi:hypothetical protein